MAMERSSKIDNSQLWISSIAVSVACCSILFVLFASYLVDIKDDIRSNMIHINAVEDRQNHVLTKLEIINNRLGHVPGYSTAPATPVSTSETPDSTLQIPASDTSTMVPAGAPASDATSAPASVTVPVMPASPPSP